MCPYLSFYLILQKYTLFIVGHQLMPSHLRIRDLFKIGCVLLVDTPFYMFPMMSNLTMGSHGKQIRVHAWLSRHNK
jgi:hypothetical protein